MDMDKQRVIVLNDVSDVTEEVRNCIIKNDLDVLQVNYNSDDNHLSPFDGMNDLTEINFEIKLGNNVQSLFEFFYNCKALETVPLFNTQNVTNMGFMFAHCEALETVPLLDTKRVANMSFMFWDCQSLKPVPLFDTKNVKDMVSMFRNCSVGI